MTDQSNEDGLDRDTAEPLDSVVSRAVELGYKVIEEQIQQGQQIAEQLASGKIDATVVNGNISELGERVLRFYSDMGALWFEMLESVMRNPAMSEWFSSLKADVGEQINGFAHNGATQAAANGHSNIPVEIVSSEPTGARVSADLHSHCEFELMIAQSLRARDSNQPPLTDVAFVPASDGWQPTIRVSIPEGQPSGTYSGLILNTASDEPVGTLCVHIPSRSTKPAD